MTYGKRKRKKKVFIDKTLSTREVVEKYSVSRTTAWRARKSGWFVKNCHVKQQPGVNLAHWDSKKTYDTIDHVIRCRFRYILEWNVLDDIIQECILRCLELSSISTGRDYQWRVIETTVKGYMKRMKNPCSNRVTKLINSMMLGQNDQENEAFELSDQEMVLMQIKFLVGPDVFKKALDGNEAAIQKIAEVI